MKLGVISDVHANKPALEAVLSDMSSYNVDELIVLGDITGILGSPEYCISTVREESDHVIYGNHDWMHFPETSEYQWLSDDEEPNKVEIAEYKENAKVSEELVEWLSSLPVTKTIHEKVILVHSHPGKDDPAGVEPGNVGIPPRDFVSVGANYLDDGNILLVGHTHYQHAVDLDKYDGQSGLVLNPGAVGFPFDYDQLYTEDKVKPVGKASYAVVDVGTMEYYLESVEYESSSVQRHLSNIGLL